MLILIGYQLRIEAKKVFPMKGFSRIDPSRWFMALSPTRGDRGNLHLENGRVLRTLMGDFTRRGD